MSSLPPALSFNFLLGRRIRAQRLLLGLTQQQVAAAVGVSFQQLQKYESGKNQVSADRLARFAEVLGVPVATLMGEEAPVAGPGRARMELQLMRAFQRIPSPERRHLLCQVAEALSEGAS